MFDKVDKDVQRAFGRILLMDGCLISVDLVRMDPFFASFYDGWQGKEGRNVF